MSRRSSGSPPVRISEAVGREGRDLVDDPAGTPSVSSSLRSAKAASRLRRLAAGVEVAVLAGEVAAVGEVPGDDVRAREGVVLVGEGRRPRHRHIPKKLLGSVEYRLVDLGEAVLLREPLDAGARHRPHELGDRLSRSQRLAVDPLRPPACRRRPERRLATGQPWHHRRERALRTRRPAARADLHAERRAPSGSRAGW